MAGFFRRFFAFLGAPAPQIPASHAPAPAPRVADPQPATAKPSPQPTQASQPTALKVVLRSDQALLADESVIITRERAASLGTRVEVKGTLKIRDCPILEELPDDTRVGGDLIVENCPRLRTLPDGIDVQGSLVIRGCPRLEVLPTTMRVGGDFKILGITRLDTFPASLDVARDIVLDRSVARIEQGLTVHGNLALLRCSRLKQLPKGLRVGGDLIVRRTPIEELPTGVCVGGGLEFCFAPISSLPRDLSLGDFLDLEGCSQLTDIPEGLEIPGWLRLARCTRLRRLPAITIGYGPRRDTRGPQWNRNILMRPHRSQMVHGRLNLENCRALEALAEGVRVSAGIEVAGTLLRSLPESCQHVTLLWRGVQVTPQVAFRPETLTAEDVVATANVELRRVKLERIGLERFVEFVGRSSLAVVDQDLDAGGVRRLLRMSIVSGGEQVACLECRCPSTARVYLLRVPPAIQSCRAAAAWIAGFDDPADYQPLLET